jgi:hypothetical protein
MKGFFQIKYATFFYRMSLIKFLKSSGKIILSFHFCDSVLQLKSWPGYHLEVIFDRDDIGHPNRANFLQLATISSVFSSCYK